MADLPTPSGGDPSADPPPDGAPAVCFCLSPLLFLSILVSFLRILIVRCFDSCGFMFAVVVSDFFWCIVGFFVRID